MEKETLIMVFIVSALFSVILATPLLMNEQITPQLPKLPIVEITIGIDNVTKSKNIFMSARGILGSVVYEEMSLYSANRTLIDIKNVTTIAYSTPNETFSMNVTAKIGKNVYFYNASISANYTATGHAYALIINEFPNIKSKMKLVKLTLDDIPYRQEAMEVVE